VKRKEYGEYIRKNGEGKWKYQLKRIKLEAGHYTHERLGFQLRKKRELVVLGDGEAML
jgi:hypothetical protein